MSERICFVCFFGFNQITGTPIRAKKVIEIIEKQREVMVIASGKYKNNIDYSRNQKLENKQGSLFVRLLKKNQKIKIFILWLKLLNELIRSSERNIYCFDHSSAFAASIYKILFNKNCRIIFEVHNLAVLPDRQNKLWDFIERFCYSKVDCILAPTNKMKEILVEKYTVDKNKINVIWVSADLDKIKFKPLRKSSKFIIGYGGNDSPYQGVPLMLEAAKKISSNKKIEFMFVGLDPKKYTSYASETIKFPGKLPDKEFFNSLSNCNALMVCYTGTFAETTFPSKVSNYLALGRPIIVPNTGELPFIIHLANCGVIFKQNNVDELVNRINYLYSRPFSELETFSINARKFAEEKLNPDSYEKEINEIFKKLNID